MRQVTALRQTTNLSRKALEQKEQCLDPRPTLGRRARCCFSVPLGRGVEVSLGFRRSFFMRRFDTIMFIQIACPSCGHNLKAAREHIGKKGKCKCGQVVLIEESPSLFDGFALPGDAMRELLDEADARMKRQAMEQASLQRMPAVADTPVGAQPPQILRLYGRQEKTVVVDGATIKIIKEESFWAARRVKSLLIRNITSVEVKEPSGMWVGFIQFSIAGGPVEDSSYTMSGGAFDAADDENSVLFADQEAYQTSLKIKEYVEAYQDRSPSGSSAVSAADEIVKLKALMDQGIISPEEFATKKRRLIES